MADRTIAPKDRARYEQHAAPENIAARLTQAQTDLRAQERYVQWLEELLARRTAEKAAGTWGADPLQPGDRVEIDAPGITPNHGRQGTVVNADEFAVSVLLNGDSDRDGPWLFGRSAVKRIETEGEPQ